MKIITLEEHYADQRIMDANKAFNKNRPPMMPEQAEAMKFLMSRSFPGPELLDFEKRIEYMDRNRINVQVLSMTSPVSDLVPAEEQVRICRQANDITKQHMDEYPGRFQGFASLPMADPDAAASELERCVKKLGFCGAMLAGRYKGRFYNEAAGILPSGADPDGGAGSVLYVRCLFLDRRSGTGVGRIRMALRGGHPDHAIDPLRHL